MQQGGAGRVLVPCELDGAPGEFGRTGRGAGLAGEFGRPGAEPGQVETGQGGRVGDIRPQREGPFQMTGGLGQAEHGFRLARRLDRGGQRLRGAARLRPVRRELGRRGSRGTRQFPGEAGVQLLALAGEDRRVDGFGQQRVAEPEGARGLVGHEDLVLDGLAQRLPHVGFGDRGEGAEQRVADVAPGRGRQPQQALGRGVEPFHPLQQQVAHAARQLGGRRRRRGALRRRRGYPRSGRRSRRPAQGRARRVRPRGRAAPSGPRAGAGRDRARGRNPSGARRRPAGPCAPSRMARPGGWWRAAPPVVRPGCGRGRRPG